jgi:hypothetical protein
LQAGVNLVAPDEHGFGAGRDEHVRDQAAGHPDLLSPEVLEGTDWDAGVNDVEVMLQRREKENPVRLVHAPREIEPAEFEVPGLPLVGPV